MHTISTFLRTGFCLLGLAFIPLQELQAQGSTCPPPDPISGSTCQSYTNPANISSGDHEKHGSNIYSGSTLISGPATVKWQAAKSVHLDNGFEANPGTGYFHASGLHAEVLEPTPILGTVSVPQYEKLEIGIKLPPALETRLDLETLNPFDTELIQVDAFFYDVNGVETYRPGFYYEDVVRTVNSATQDYNGWERQATDFRFRVRFAPEKTGQYHCRIRVTLGQGLADWLHLDKELRSDCIDFQCVSGSHRGYLQVGSDNRHLKASNDGETFFPVGENQFNPNWWGMHEEIYPEAVTGEADKLQTWLDNEIQFLDELDQVGGNMLRRGIEQISYGLEYGTGQPGDYRPRMGAAWELDQFLEKCRDREIYVILSLFLHHDFFARDRPYLFEICWPYNPYFYLPNVQCPMDFFLDATARKFVKRYLRYVQGRWGWDPQIGSMEMFTELDKAANGICKGCDNPNWVGLDNRDIAEERLTADGQELWVYECAQFQNSNTDWFHFRTEDGKEVVKDWMDEMTCFMKGSLQSKHLLTASHAQSKTFVDHPSFTLDEYNSEHHIWDLPNLDLVSVHRYGNVPNMHQLRYELGVNFRENFLLKNWIPKPFHYNEKGPGDGADINPLTDVPYHCSSWSTAMSGHIGTGFDWYVEANHNSPTANYTHLGPIAQYFANEDFENLSFEPSLNFSNSGNIEHYYMAAQADGRVLGWVHDLDVYWDDNISAVPPLSNLSNEVIQIPTFFAFDEYTVTWYRITGPNLTYHQSTTFTSPFGFFNGIELDVPPMIVANSNNQFTGENFAFAYKIEFRRNNQASTKDAETGNSQAQGQSKEELRVQLGPVPTRDVLNLSFSHFPREGFDISILDSRGQLVKSLRFSSQLFNRIDVSEMADGVYFLEIQSGDQNLKKRFVIQH